MGECSYLKKMNVSVVIAHYQEPHNLVATIRSIRETSDIARVEIIVVDDGGFYPGAPSGKEQPIADFSTKENIVFVAAPDRMGNAFCRTLGAKHASGDWLLFTDAHMVFEPGWFENFAEHAHETRTVFCGPYLASRAEWEGKQAPTVFWGADHYYWRRNLPDGRPWDLLGVFPRKPPSERAGAIEPVEVPAVIGANYFVEREWFRNIGGLPCQYGWSVDEWPLSVKTWLAGGSVKMIPGVRLRHVLHKTGHGADGYGKQMTQDQMLYNKLSVAWQTMTPGQFSRFYSTLPLPTGSPEKKEAARMIDRHSEQLNYWRTFLKTRLYHDVDWLCARFDLEHPDDIGGE